MITLEKKTSDDYKLHSIIYFFRLRAYYEVNGYQVWVVIDVGPMINSS